MKTISTPKEKFKMPTKDEIDEKLMELLNRVEMKSDIRAVSKYIRQLLKLSTGKEVEKEENVIRCDKIPDNTSLWNVLLGVRDLKYYMQDAAIYIQQMKSNTNNL